MSAGLERGGLVGEGYRILAPLARGGMGDVYLATKEGSGELRALKLLRSAWEPDNKSRARFLREADVARRLQSPRIVEVYEAGIDPQRDLPWIGMELLRGMSLTEAVGELGPLSRAATLRIAEQLAEALRVAHGEGILHLDLKPENLYLCRDEEGEPGIKVLDFGISKILEGQKTAATVTSAVGTPAWMAPEQAEAGEKLRPSTDLWAYGLLLFYMLTGRAYWPSLSISTFNHLSLTREVLLDPLVPASERARELGFEGALPAGFDAWMARCVVREQELRFETIEEASEALTALLEGSLEGARAEADLGRLRAALAEAEAAFAERLAAAEEEASAASARFSVPPAGPRAEGGGREHARSILLGKVHSFWVEGVLDKSLGPEEWIPLRLRAETDAVERPWEKESRQLVLSSGEFERKEVEAELDLAGHLDAAGRALLLLGAPGSGKTASMLKLARDLLERAERSASEPIPVILSLASWAERRGPLAEWILSELSAKYQIPRRLGSEWLSEDALLLLLDDLDAAERGAPGACVEAINEFRLERGLTGLLVCSRAEDYWASQARLKMGGAARVQALSPAQIRAALRLDAERNALLLKALQREPALAEMARRPQMLSLMRLVYEPTSGAGPARALSENEASTLEQRRLRLLDTYTKRMLRRAGSGGPAGSSAGYSAEATEEGLRWLASSMEAHNQRLLLLEQLQSSWLPTRAGRWAYLFASRALVGVASGLATGLASETTAAVVPGHHLHTAEAADAFVGLPHSGVLAHLLLGLGAGLLLGLFDGLLFERRWGREDEAKILPGRAWAHILGAAGCSYLASLPVLLAFDAPLNALLEGTFLAIAINTFSDYRHGSHSHRTEVGIVEALSWSWREALALSLPGLILSALVGAARGFQYGPSVGLLIGGSLLLFFFLWGGLRGTRLNDRSRPNEGIALSLKKGLTAALLFGLSQGVIYGLASSLRAGLLMWLAASIAGAMAFGIFPAFKHLLIRLLLRLDPRAPRPLPRFLEHATSLALLRRVGGGYLFAQSLLQDRLAQTR